jgi:hypothetical protein
VTPSGQQATYVAIDLARTDSGKNFYYPRELARELDTLGNLDRIREAFNLCPLEGMSYEQASPRIAQVLTAQFLPAAKPPEFDTLTYTVTESHFKALLDAQEHFDLSLQELVD